MVWSADVCLTGLLIGQTMTSQGRHQLTTPSSKVNKISSSYYAIDYRRVYVRGKYFSKSGQIAAGIVLGI